jgi:hypothetical protein
MSNLATVVNESKFGISTVHYYPKMIDSLLPVLIPLKRRPLAPYSFVGAASTIWTHKYGTKSLLWTGLTTIAIPKVALSTNGKRMGTYIPDIYLSRGFYVIT